MRLSVDFCKVRSRLCFKTNPGSYILRTTRHIEICLKKLKLFCIGQIFQLFLCLVNFFAIFIYAFPCILHPAAVFGGPFAALVGAGVLDGPIVHRTGIFPVLHSLGQSLVPAAPGLDKLLKT